MKSYQVLFITFIFLICSCKEEVVYNYQAEIDQLSTYVKQSEYLEKIYHLDQNIRNENKSDLKEIDDVNLAKIEAYISKHGHPSLKTHTKEATIVPWIVIHHNPSKETSKKHFKTLYQAYKKGDIDGGDFTMYLGRYYSVVNNKRLDLESPYTEEFEIDTLVKALDLQQLRDEVDLVLEKP
ncbi:MAG: hypothetical protein IPN86_14690 [Saprospiraceae bacterium]|nr:hypothetical protein [Saprospiraceae bacterium]